MKVTRRPATGEESVEFAHRDIPFGLQRETAEETSEDRRDTDRHEAGDIDVDRLLLGMPDEKEDPTQHELESRAVMAGWEKIRKHLIDVVAEDAVMPPGQVCIPLYRQYWFIVKVCLNCKCSASLHCGPLAYYCSECFGNFHMSKVGGTVHQYIVR